MDRYANGDDGAFGQVYDALAPKLYRFLMQRCRERTHAEDLVQQTFLRMHRARGSFVAGARVLPWAFAIARRLLIDDIRATRHETTGDLRQLEQLATLETADEGVHREQLSRVVDRELSSIPESQRVAFELVKQQGLSLADAAAVLGVSITAVKLRLHRATSSLRAAIEALACEVA
jgi:RNA polymerase sigma-70 factor (ECF subfamily)